MAYPWWIWISSRKKMLTRLQYALSAVGLRGSVGIVNVNSYFGRKRWIQSSDEREALSERIYKSVWSTTLLLSLILQCFEACTTNEFS